ncbi:pilus assembly protein TadG-related protein [Paenarthrobacter sp. NyZ202]|uniref:pilus assembly protein TadG-related protein n=1 Tax=Paenarthrobacter sp. NyZ202 TaxID=3402689 RepID=UPI003CE73294
MTPQEPTDAPAAAGNQCPAGCSRLYRGGSNEDGQISVLIVGYLVLVLLVAAVVMAVSAVYLEHKKLLSLADGAALAAADTYGPEALQAAGAPALSLTGDKVRHAVQRYLEASQAVPLHDRLEIAPGTGSSSGGTAVVVLTSVAHPPLVSLLLPEGIVVEAKSSARSRLTQ